MANEALIKMIDTYISQLTEIRNDVNNIEDNIYTNYTNEEMAYFIAKMLKTRKTTDIAEIIKGICFLTNMTVKAVSGTSANEVSLEDVDMSEFESLLLKAGYKVIKEAYGSDSNKTRLRVKRNNGLYALELKFDEYNNITSIDINLS